MAGECIKITVNVLHVHFHRLKFEPAIFSLKNYGRRNYLVPLQRGWFMSGLGVCEAWLRRWEAVAVSEMQDEEDDETESD